ncbi:transmembrane protein 276 [Monodelphis domestica]|uniref:Transmembrane protein 276 n=1 Tax=Monodelphis domestica TaxID=13616 RepID=F7EPE3_MONDO|nr:transmembrane protein 276 [Monodelphis domestica]
MADKPEEWSTQLSYLVLGIVSLHSAVHTTRVNRGAAAGFLLQALAAAAALVSGPQPDTNNQMATWVATVIGLPLLAFDFHWVNGDCSTANLLLGAGMVLAIAGDFLDTETQAVAGQAVALVAAVTILIVSVFTVNTYGVGGGMALGAASLMSRLEEETLLFFQKEDACRWALALGSWAYRWALHTQHLELD